MLWAPAMLVTEAHSKAYSHEEGWLNAVHMQ